MELVVTRRFIFSLTEKNKFLTHMYFTKIHNVYLNKTVHYNSSIFIFHCIIHIRNIPYTWIKNITSNSAFPFKKYIEYFLFDLISIFSIIFSKN